MRIYLVAAAAVVALIGARAVSAQPPPVSRVTAVVRPPHYQGPCPARFEFIGTIFMNNSAIVTYRWERSDHAIGPVQSIDIRGPAQSVQTTWQIGGPPGRMFNGSETLHVLSPINMYSNPASLSLFCQ